MHCDKIEFFRVICIGEKYGAAEFRFFGLGLENLFLMLMVYRMGKVGKLFSYVISTTVKYFR